jgi:protein TonB
LEPSTTSVANATATGLPADSNTQPKQLAGPARAKYLGENFAYISKRIGRALRYPRKAQRAGISGQTKVRFIICANGQVRAIEVVKSSGYAILDNDAIKTVKRAAPFPPPPIEAVLIMPISYQQR